MYDAKTDAYYYFNHDTGASSWYPPEDKAVPEVPGQRSRPRPSSAAAYASSAHTEGSRREADTSLEGRVEDFLANNEVELHAADDLRDCPPQVQELVLAK